MPNRRADIEAVVGYQPVRCVYPTVRPFQHLYEAPSSGPGQDREIDVWCFTHAYTFPNRKVKSGVGKLREGSLMYFVIIYHVIYIIPQTLQYTIISYHI